MGEIVMRERCADCHSMAILEMNAGELPDYLAGDDERLQKMFRPKKLFCGMCGSEHIELVPVEIKGKGSSNV